MVEPSSNASSQPEPAASSSRSKGKGRAVSPTTLTDRADDEASAALPGISFNIRFTDGTTEDVKDLYVNQGEPVREVKRRIRLLRTSTSTCRLRLIYNGRIITDGTRLVPWMTAILRRQKQQEEDAARRIGDSIRDGVHALERGFKSAVAAEEDQDEDGSSGSTVDNKGKSKAIGGHKGKGKQREETTSSTTSPIIDRVIWLHCSVGEPGSLSEEVEANKANNATADGQQAGNNEDSRTQPLSGFDRLREVGFSEDEIESMRRQFHVDGPNDTTVAGDEDEHARALEEQWMEGFGANGGNAPLEASPNSDMYTTLFKGVIAGFFFPFLPLFFFRSETAVFSKRMQMAIVAGLSINVLYGALRAFT